MTNIPIIFIHKGNSNYLPYTFFQAKASNPNSPIYLIGTKETKHFNSLVTHIDIENYFSEAKEFGETYKHFSTNGYDFELVCLQRWFVLKEFLLDKNIERCVYIDSDILIFSNLTEVANTLKDYSMTILGISPHTNFINSRNFFIQFCQYLMENYTVADSFGALHTKYLKYINDRGAGGISDMTYFYEYRQKYPEKIADISDIRNGATFDITLDTPNGYEMENGIKKIIWKDDSPHCINLATGNLVKYHSLHFQGRMKKHITSFVRLKSIKFYLASNYFYGRYLASKILGKFKKIFQ